MVLAVEMRAELIRTPYRSRYLDARADNLDDALAKIKKANADGKAISIGIIGNASEVYPARNRSRGRHRRCQGDNGPTGARHAGWSTSEVERRLVLDGMTRLRVRPRQRVLASSLKRMMATCLKAFVRIRAAPLRPPHR